MLSMNNASDNLKPAYFDYDLIALSNTLSYSFGEGLHLASSMLNAPFFVTNLYDYVIIRSETVKIDDPIWENISKTGFCNPAAIAESGNIYSVMIPNIGKMVYYPDSKPTDRQRQLATYIAWIISQFRKEEFYISESGSNPKSAFLFYLINKRFDMIDNQFDAFSTGRLPDRMQVLACFHSAASTEYVVEISKICNHTEYITIYKQKYWILLFPALTPEEDRTLSKLLSRYCFYAGLSYPFSCYNDCHNYTLQAIAALKEAIKLDHKNHLARYEDLFALDVLYNYYSDEPLSSFRHPIFLFLEEYDKNSNTELYATLMAHIENSGNTQETAKQLSVHRNTVSYRLRQITDITDLNVQSPHCRASLLYAAAIERSLRGAKR